MYKIIRKGTTFTARGFTPDVVLSKHKNGKSAYKAFEKVIGRAVLLHPDGTVIDSKIA